MNNNKSNNNNNNNNVTCTSLRELQMRRNIKQLSGPRPSQVDSLLQTNDDYRESSSTDVSKALIISKERRLPHDPRRVEEPHQKWRRGNRRRRSLVRRFI